ncbi:type VII secretion target [Actinokineospora enzanensis]|uniref:type VII secretion target n=1 Tax=Actinokineospora enzanensis TaxID=155975 RepID=UPI000380C9D5|nr:type VII secretion target [Actinokineospora enzanensis]
MAIEVDPRWVSDYAKKVASAADELGKGVDILRTAPLTPEAFGSLGRTAKVTDSYTRAADLLRTQLTRGVAALESAAHALGEVADKYRGSDDDGAHTITRSGQA